MPGYVQHFTHAGNDKMKCRYCQEDIKFTNSHLHSSNLRNHLTFKHPEKLSVPKKAKVPKIDDYFTGHKSSLPSLPALDRQTLAVCCSAHPLPFNLVEDKVFQWAYNCPVKDRRPFGQRYIESDSHRSGDPYTCAFCHSFCKDPELVGEKHDVVSGDQK